METPRTDEKHAQVESDLLCMRRSWYEAYQEMREHAEMLEKALRAVDHWRQIT